MRKRTEDAIRTIAAMPDDDWQPYDWHSFMEARAVFVEELARLDRAATRKPVRGGSGLSMGGKTADIPSASRDVVNRRSGGRCEAATPDCEGRATQIHHIAGRGWKGCHAPSLLLAVCGMGNATGCHGWIHDDRPRAEALGLLAPWGPPRTENR